MVRVLHRYITKKLHFPVDGYLYDVQRWASVDGGKNYYYCGYGKYFKDEESARAWIEKDMEGNKQ